MQLSTWASLYITVVLVATCYAKIQPIWLSPTNVDLSTNGGTDLSNVEESYVAQKGVWTNLTVGTGSRTLGPAIAMDSKGTLWILFGSRERLEDIYRYNVWNYDPKTDLYRYVWGNNDTASNNPRDAGELRVPSETNHPGTVLYATMTIDDNDNLWFVSYQYSGELWMFNTTSMMFTRMFGLDGVTGAPSYGTDHQPSENVHPGYLEANCMVTDSTNNIWVLSGACFDGNWNAVWHFNTTSYLWTFVSGDPPATSPANSTDYVGTWNPACFIDENDKVWLYGGYGNLDVGLSDDSPSMWTYDTRGKREWELEFQPTPWNGRETIFPVSVSVDYNADNHPGGCEGCILTDRMDGTLMLLASGSYTIGGASYGTTNQVWQYSKSLKQWRLVYGNTTSTGFTGEYNDYRQPGSEMPGLYYNSRSNGKNMNGDLYVYGGDSSSGTVGIKDIWLIPNDQCSSPTANKCDANADCIEEMIGYSCECKQGYTGDGFTCTLIPPVAPVAVPSSAGTPSATPASTNTPSKKTSSASVAVGTSIVGIALTLVALV